MRAESSRERLVWERAHCRISNDGAETFYRYQKKNEDRRMGKGSLT